MINSKSLSRLENIILYSSSLYEFEIDSLRLLCKIPSEAEESYIYLKTSQNLESLQDLSFMDLCDKKVFRSVINFLSHYIAYSVIMVNEENILKDRENFITQMVKFLNTMPYEFLHSIVSKLLLIKADDMSAIQYLPDFLKTDSGTLYKAAFLKYKFNDTRLTGIPYYSQLPASNIQLIFMNLVESSYKTEIFELLKHLVKLLVGQINPKAVQSMDKEELIRKVNQIKDKRSDLSRVVGITSKEELLSQLDDMLEGKVDDFDRIFMRREEESYQRWRQDFLDSIANVDFDSVIGGVKLDKPDLSEEALRARYSRQFKFAYWATASKVTE